MTIAAAITLGISIATFLLGIIYKLGDLSMKFWRLTKTIEANELHHPVRIFRLLCEYFLVKTF